MRKEAIAEQRSKERIMKGESLTNTYEKFRRKPIISCAIGGGIDGDTTSRGTCTRIIVRQDDSHDREENLERILPCRSMISIGNVVQIFRERNISKKIEERKSDTST